MKNILLALCLMATITLSAQPRGPQRGTEFEYPDAHDPVAAFCDGRYYVFTTGMGIMSSADLVKWRFEGRVLDDIPQWAADKGFKGKDVETWTLDVSGNNGNITLRNADGKYLIRSASSANRALALAKAA